MATLDQLKALFPDAASDSDVIKKAAAEFGISPAEIASEVGIKINAPGMWTSVKRGVGQVESAIGSTARDLGIDRAGRALESYGEDVAFRNPSGINTVGEAISSPWLTAKEAVGELAPQLGASVVTGVGGRIVGGALGLPFGPAGVAIGQNVGAGAGAYIGNLIQEYGGIRSEQREKGIEDKTRALGTGAAAAVLDTAFGAERLVNKIGNKGLNILSREAGEKLSPHVLKQTGLGFLGEAGTETIQTGLERYGAYKNLTDADALNEYGLAAIKGGLGGGIVRGGLSAVAGERENTSLLPDTNQGAAPTAQGAPANDISQAFQANDRTTPDSIMSGLVGRAADPLAGRSTLYGQQAPAVTGGETEIAQAQQQAQAEAQQIQAAQQQQAAREQIYTNFNIADPQNPTKGNLFGKPLFGRNVPAVADAVGATVKTMTPYQLEVAQAVNKANAETGGKLLNFQFNANDPAKSVQKAFDAIAKVAVGFQIADVQSTQEAAQILDEQSKTLSGTKLEQLNAIHFALTGEDTSGYTAAQQSKAEKGAKDGKLQLQTTTGLGTVPVEGGTGEANAGGAGPVRSTEVQPIGAAGLGEGSLGLQTGQLPAGGVRAGTSADTGLGNGQPTQNTQINGQTQAAVSGAPQVTTERQTDENLGAVPSVQQEQAIEEQQVEGVPGLIRAALRMIYKSDRKVDLLLRLTEKTQRGDYAALAKEYDVSEQYVKELASDAITDEGEQFPRFIMKNIDKFMAAVNTQAEQSGISVLEALDALQVIHDAYEGGEAAQVGTQVDESDLINAGLEIQNVKERTDNQGKGTGKIDRTNVSDLAEEGNRMEALMQQYLDLSNELEAATEANDERTAELEQQVAELTAKIAEAEKKEKARVRAMAGKQAPKETENAVQEQSTDEGNVREPAGGGEAVGEGNAKPQKPARKAKQTKAVVKPTETPPQVKTPAEQWAELADQFPAMPPYESLTQDEKTRWDDLASRGVANLAAANRLLEGDVTTRAAEVPSTAGADEKVEGKFGKDGAVATPYTVAELTKEISDFVRTAVNTRKLKIVGNIRDLLESDDPTEQKLGAVLALNRAYGVATNGRAYLIADRISKGQGRAKFLHEVGVHLGMEGLLPDEQFDTLTDQIFEWAKRDDNSREAQLAVRAILRADAAQTPDEDLRSEVLAYFVEEATQAGIEPSAAMKLGGPLGKWFRTLYAAFKAAVRRLGMNPEKLTAQDVVNMAYGAARLEMTGAMVAGPTRPKFGFAGIKAAGAATEEKKASLAAAQLDVANGVDPKTVWEQTGWYKGIDGQWRFEIDDSKAQFKGVLEGKSFRDIARMEETTLGEILSHDELFTQYPELRDVKFEVRSIPLDIYRSTQGWFDVAQNKLFVTPYATNPLSTVLHEAQHWIQNKEGFENGANPDSSDLSNRAALDKLRKELTATISRAEALEADRKTAIKEGRYVSIFDEVVAASKAKDLIPAVDALLAKSSELAPMYAQLRALDAEIDRVEKARKVLTQKQKEQNKQANLAKKIIDYAGQMKDLRIYTNKAAAAQKERGEINAKLKSEIIKITGGKDVAYELYRLVAGEAEARNVQTRQKLTAEERKAKPPEATMDVRAENTLRATGRGGVYMNTARMRFGIEATLPPVVLKPAKSVVTNLATAARNGLLSAGITEDIVNMAKKYMRSAGDYLDAQYARQKTRLEFEMRIERIEEAFERLPKELQGTGANSVNRYILDSTMQRKWGYYPGEHRIGTELFEVDPDLEKRFDAFPPAAQKVIRDVFEHGYTALKLKQSAVSKAVEREFAEREKAAIGDADMLAQLQKERKEMVARLTRLQNIDFTTPYAYLGRYGDYVVVAKSKEFKHWQERAKLNDFDREQAQGWLAENVSNPDHYVVQFVESQGEADQIAAELIATGKYDMDGTEAGPKEDVGSYIGSDVHLAVARLRNLADRQQDEGSEELDKLLSDLYLLTAAENSARKSEFMRKYVSGADANMMRNLATSGRADAHFLSTMEHNDDITDAMERMRDEARDNRRDAMPLYNELFKRQAQSLNYNQPSILSQALTQASAVWFLSTSPAFYLQQILQTSVLSLPYMSGRLGYFRSVRAIKAAYADVAELVKGVGVGEHIDFSKAPADVRQMLQTLVGMGKIDIGIDSDTKARASEQGPAGKVMRKLQNLNSRIEAVNRSTAAIAAYRGYIQRYGNNPDAATKYAAEVVSNTHGSYDGFNTPRILNSDVGRVVGQFKRFQIIQLSMLGKLINNAFKGASAEEKAIARRSLAFIGGHMAVLGGALGVPFVQQIGSLVTKLLGDEDEPDDFEYKMRQMIGDKTMADLLLNGVPAALGVNLGGKLGMGNVASILPFTDVDLSSRSGYEKVMVGMMGPFFGGLAPKFIDGAGMIAKGEYYKGLELLAPNGIGNAMKGLRYANEGISMRNGDVVLKPEEISMLDAAFQAVGLPTTTITGRQYAQRTMAEFDKFYSDRAAEIKGAYVNASREGDTEGMADARQEWQKLQDSRRRNGYKIQPMSELFKATIAARKREASVVGGVETSKSNKQFAANLI